MIEIPLVSSRLRESQYDVARTGREKLTCDLVLGHLVCADVNQNQLQKSVSEVMCLHREAQSMDNLVLEFSMLRELFPTVEVGVKADYPVLQDAVSTLSLRGGCRLENPLEAGFEILGSGGMGLLN